MMCKSHITQDVSEKKRVLYKYIICSPRMESSPCAPLGTTAVVNFYAMDSRGLATSFRGRLSPGT